MYVADILSFINLIVSLDTFFLNEIFFCIAKLFNQLKLNEIKYICCNYSWYKEIKFAIIDDKCDKNFLIKKGL